MTTTIPPEETEALDAYSRVVVDVAERLAPSVANLKVMRRSRAGHCWEAQIARFKAASLRDGEGPQDRALQLSNVARPSVMHQCLHVFRKNIFDSSVHLAFILAHKVPDQGWNVIGAVAQWRDFNGEDA